MAPTPMCWSRRWETRRISGGSRANRPTPSQSFRYALKGEVPGIRPFPSVRRVRMRGLTLRGVVPGGSRSRHGSSASMPKLDEVAAFPFLLKSRSQQFRGCWPRLADSKEPAWCQAACGQLRSVRACVCDLLGVGKCIGGGRSMLVCECDRSPSWWRSPSSLH